MKTSILSKGGSASIDLCLEEAMLHIIVQPAFEVSHEPMAVLVAQRVYPGRWQQYHHPAL